MILASGGQKKLFFCPQACCWNNHLHFWKIKNEKVKHSNQFLLFYTSWKVRSRYRSTILIQNWMNLFPQMRHIIIVEFPHLSTRKNRIRSLVFTSNLSNVHLASPNRSDSRLQYQLLHPRNLLESTEKHWNLPSERSRQSNRNHHDLDHLFLLFSKRSECSPLQYFPWSDTYRQSTIRMERGKTSLNN